MWEVALAEDGEAGTVTVGKHMSISRSCNKDEWEGRENGATLEWQTGI